MKTILAAGAALLFILPLPSFAEGIWTGPYAGGNIGFGQASSSYTGTSGYLFGVQGGYNIEADNGVVFGIEGELESEHLTGAYSYRWTSTAAGTGPAFSTSTAQNLTETLTTNWSGTLAGRLGYDLGTIMPYATAGVAVANSTYRTASVSNPPSPTSDYDSSSTAVSIGLMAGVGVEVTLSDRLSAFVDARLIDYPNATFTTASRTSTSTISMPITEAAVRTGLNYHF